MSNKLLYLYVLHTKLISLSTLIVSKSFPWKVTRIHRQHPALLSATITYHAKNNLEQVILRCMMYSTTNLFHRFVGWAPFCRDVSGRNLYPQGVCHTKLSTQNWAHNLSTWSEHTKLTMKRRLFTKIAIFTTVVNIAQTVNREQSPQELRQINHLITSKHTF